MVDTKKQHIIPHTVGNTTETAAHFRLPVSFFMVKHVVEHGQCIRENSTVQIAVVIVQPFATNRLRSSASDAYSVNVPVHR